MMSDICRHNRKELEKQWERVSSVLTREEEKIYADEISTRSIATWIYL
jgi:hypothetical protein